MPPKIRYSKAEILHAAFKLTREKGAEAVNARSIAKELGCSTQPIFRAFQNMDNIHAEIRSMSMELYNIYMMRSGTQAKTAYMEAGLAYVTFAREEPEIFRLLFMCDRSGNGAAEAVHQLTPDFIIDIVMNRTGLDRETARRFHSQIWIYMHGLATMITTRYIDVSQEQIESMMEEIYQAMGKLYGITEPKD